MSPERTLEPDKTVFFLLEATQAWLAQAPAQRDRFVHDVLRPILARHPGVTLRYFDAEAYSANTSDVLMWQFHSEREYERLVEALRETAFWNGYFRVREIVRCVEDGFAKHYGFQGFAQG